MFGQVLDKVSSYFGPGFLVARYFPWLICVAVNVAIACIEFPAVRAFIVQEYNALAGSKALDLAIALIGIAIVAYAMGPFIQAVTAFLEGAWIPDWMAQFL